MPASLIVTFLYFKSLKIFFSLLLVESIILFIFTIIQWRNCIHRCWFTLKRDPGLTLKTDPLYKRAYKPLITFNHCSKLLSRLASAKQSDALTDAFCNDTGSIFNEKWVKCMCKSTIEKEVRLILYFKSRKDNRWIIIF